MTLFGILLFGLILVAALSAMLPLYSYAFTLHQPLDCTIGTDCFIQNYVDIDPSKGWKDYRCGHLSYDGHKGTDFRLINLEQMRQGVNVLAVADGTVEGIRDGMADINFNDTVPVQINGRECGNGVRVKHERGYHTQYCHMKHGSIQVKAGDTVKVGQVLGQVGLSGRTEFPHLHLQVSDKDEQIIDPFSGPMLSSECGGFGTKLWDVSIQNALRYRDIALINAGFSATVPNARAMRDNPKANTTVNADSDVIALWTDIMGPKKDNVLYMMIKSPKGKQLVYHSQKIEQNQAQLFQFIGKKRRDQPWHAGSYIGYITLKATEDIDAPTLLKKEVELIIADPAADAH